MTETVILYSVCALMIVLALALVLPSFFSRKHAPDASHEEALAQRLREEAERLDAEYARGEHDEASYHALKEDLERRVVRELAELRGADEEARSQASPHPNRSPALTVAAVATVIVALPCALYAALGSPEVMGLIDAQHVMQGSAKDPEQIKTYLKSNARDGRAWILLARREAELNRLDEAAKAYRKGREVDSRIKRDPSVMLELSATLVAIGKVENMKEALTLAEEALQLEPGNMTAVEMAGIASLALEDFGAALPYLQILLKHTKPDTPAYVRLENTVRGIEAMLKNAHEELYGKKGEKPQTQAEAKP